MKAKILLFLLMTALLSGCNAAMVMNGKVMGISSGKFFYQDGYLTTHYKADIEPVWQACNKAVIDLKGRDIQKDRKIASGSIKAIILDEKVTILIEYIEKDLTSVSVITGITGNNMASRFIQDRIAENIVKN
ncbi:MAG: hypothetical protein CVU51_04695 [Deltaproteobacteria bacterium HGW-Deltaproteobacteria-1]|jgi:hypothetical protein|nr:MAG: hypothetical protein CVU51_04695 [Deltaproteobacteria bacterium HGW-Deltaproteobacteria-1]